MLPNFLIVGAQKGGTTSLARYLKNHPQVFMSATKELDFFIEELNWHLGVSWYEGQFEDAGEAIALGEASPNYSSYPVFEGVPARIAGLIPNVRLIYVLRNPIERMQSEYLHRTLLGREQLPIQEALTSNTVYLARSSYALQIEKYLEHFSRDQLLITTSSELRHSRPATMRKIFRFIHVDEDWWHPKLEREWHLTSQKNQPRRLAHVVRRLPGYSAAAKAAPAAAHHLFERIAIRRVRPEAAELSSALREELEALLREDVRRLRTYLGEDFDGWGIA